MRWINVTKFHFILQKKKKRYQEYLGCSFILFPLYTGVMLSEQMLCFRPNMMIRVTEQGAWSTSCKITCRATVSSGSYRSVIRQSNCSMVKLKLEKLVWKNRRHLTLCPLVFELCKSLYLLLLPFLTTSKFFGIRILQIKLYHLPKSLIV